VAACALQTVRLCALNTTIVVIIIIMLTHAFLSDHRVVTFEVIVRL